MHPETITLTRRLYKKTRNEKRTRKNCKINPETLQNKKKTEILQQISKEPGDFAKMHPETITLTRRLYKITRNVKRSRRNFKSNPETF